MMDKYLSAHFDLFRAKERAFNVVEAQGRNVRKTIYNIQKGVHEVFFYKNLPRELKTYYPKFKHYKKFKSKMVYEIELIPAYDVSVWYLRNELRPPIFKKFLIQIENYLETLPRVHVSRTRWCQSTQKLIIEKLNSRWSEYTRTPTFKQMEAIFQIKYGVNLRKFKTALSSDLKRKIQTFGEGSLHFNHGDLCFSNILMATSKKIKLIDPKGASNKGDLYFTIYYDLAKLSHSINGNYDGIISGNKIRFSDQQKLFSQWLKQLGFDVRFVRMIEASLFLSMLPLHYNRPETHFQFLQAALAAHKASQ